MIDHAILRPALPNDIPALLAIDEAAGALFRGTGLLPSEEPDPHLAAHLGVGIGEGFCAVARSGTRDPAGFALCRLEGEDLYLDQISVHPDAMRQRLGHALMAWCDHLARTKAARRIVLSTFRDVAWNGVWYRRLGFVELPHAALLPWMVAIEAAQRDAGLDVAQRCFMARPVGN